MTGSHFPPNNKNKYSKIKLSYFHAQAPTFPPSLSQFFYCLHLLQWHMLHQSFVYITCPGNRNIIKTNIVPLMLLPYAFFFLFLIFYLICLLLGKLVGNYVCERWLSIISAIIVIILLRFSNLITPNYTYLFSG